MPEHLYVSTLLLSHNTSRIKNKLTEYTCNGSGGLTAGL